MVHIMEGVVMDNTEDIAILEGLHRLISPVPDSTEVAAIMVEAAADMVEVVIQATIHTMCKGPCSSGDVAVVVIVVDRVGS